MQRFQKINWGVAALLFLPWAVSSIPGLSPQESWWLAWFGSMWIFSLVWSGKAGGIDTSVPWRFRVLHPIFLTQGIFAGYGFFTSIFFWLEINGIAPAAVSAAPLPRLQILAAEAQRYYVLAHASLALGLILCSRPLARNLYRPAWRGSLAALLFGVSAGASSLGVLFGVVTGLDQFAGVFGRLGFVAGAMSLGPCLAPAGRYWLLFSCGLNGILLLLALASGWKEESLVWLILVSLGTFPVLPRITVLAGVFLFLVSLVVLPVLSSTTREESWRGETSKWEALELGVENLLDISSEELVENTWNFFTGRLSEVSMFTKFIASVNSGVPREGSAILSQALLAPIPRIMWPGKPSTETLIMQRVYAHGVVSEGSSVSAKPHPVVDAYLVGGGASICLAFIIIGSAASLAYTFCAGHFGGSFLGGVFFNGLFSILWRGNAFEFMLNSLFWAALIALILDWVLRTTGLTSRRVPRKGPRRPVRKREAASAS